MLVIGGEMKLDILGTKYTYKVVDKDFDKLENAAGICRFMDKEIFVSKDNEEISDFNRVVRHEIIHAFLFESGLPEYSLDEKIVDWLAYQIPKIVDIYKKVERNS